MKKLILLLIFVCLNWTYGADTETKTTPSIMRGKSGIETGNGGDCVRIGGKCSHWISSCDLE